MIRRSFTLIIGLILVFALAACGSSSTGGEGTGAKGTLIFADAGFDSLSFHNAVAQTIVEGGYGYETDIMPGSTPATLEGLANGDIDIYMEIWTDNVIDQYSAMLEDGSVVEMGSNYADNAQGLYVPTYVIEGDADRGIEPVAPDLKTVADLEKYWELFKDPEDPNKGRIVGAIPGWAVDEIITVKVETYGLDEQYNIFRPGSGPALDTSIAKAYQSGEPWVGYYWEPTWIMGMYDMTLLEEPEYTQEGWNDGYSTAFPSVDVTIAMNSETHEETPEVAEFLTKFSSSNQLANEALAYMQDNDATAEEAAIWFLQEKEEIWSEWVPTEVADKVKAAIQ